MAEIYLSGYWDVKTGDLCPNHTAQGYFNKHSHGGASIWTLGPRPREPYPESFLWTIPYAGARYIFVFSPYDDEKPLRELPLWNAIAKHVSTDAQSQLQEVSPPGYPQVYVYQTDDIIPGYDIDTDMWDVDDNTDLTDILEGTYTVIDTQKIEEVEINWVENLNQRLNELRNNERTPYGLDQMFAE